MTVSNELIDQLLAGYKKPEDLIGENGLLKQLTKRLVERALEAEVTEHLGHTKNASVANAAGNARNGKSKKTLKGDFGELPIDIPRDRHASFEPQIVPKHQTRWTGFDDKILSLYARGMTVREIQGHLQEMYGAEVSPSLISTVTDAVMDEAKAWQGRPLEALYPIVYLDCIVIKIRDNMRVVNKSIYLALGVNMDGRKDLLGLWMSDNEGAKFWLSVLTELKSRGVQDILIACVDGLKGFPDAIAVEYPQTRIQLCLVHMVRNSLRYVSWKDYKAVTSDLKRIYQSPTEEQALVELERVGQVWNGSYPQIAKSWITHWPNLRTLFECPPDIRKAIYTTNAVESLNSVIRATTKRRKVFPNDDSARKVIYLAIEQASKKWTMPIQNWRMALNRFTIEFGDRLPDHQ